MNNFLSTVCVKNNGEYMYYAHPLKRIIKEGTKYSVIFFAFLTLSTVILKSYYQ